MPSLLDAHAHFFTPGYASLLPADCRRVQPDEFTLYSALAGQHSIAQVLAIGYEGSDWAAGNNAYLAALAQKAAWVRPLAYVEPQALTRSVLDFWHSQGFIGISLYLMDEPRAAQLDQVPGEVWDWLARHRWLVSVNSRGQLWQAWQPILVAQPDVRLLLSHLGLPSRCAVAPSRTEAASRMEAVTALARYPHVHIKLSGLYALSEPGYDYPHRTVWPYIETAIEALGPQRVVWGSDFSPALEHVSFAQTVAVVHHLTWLADRDREAILGGTLASLLLDITAKEDCP